MLRSAEHSNGELTIATLTVSAEHSNGEVTIATLTVSDLHKNVPSFFVSE